MITAPTDTVQPAIDLAALALCRTDSPQSAPKSPEVGAQQNDGLGSIEGAPIMGPMLPPTNGDTANGNSVDSVMGDDKSDASMPALELQDQSKSTDPAMSTHPAPPTRPPPIPPRPAAPTKSKLGNIEESARQQDAAEVLSNIFDLFSCAIKGDGTLSDDEQFDLIKGLFFSDVKSVRNTKPKQEESSELRDHFLVSPGWRDRNIYATLDDDFGLSEMEDGLTKYDYVDVPAPVQIINLRRLQFDRAKGEQVYDRSHIRLEKRVYLDRYLRKTRTHAQDQLLELRKAQWEKQSQLRELDARRNGLRRTDVDGLDFPDIVEETSAFIQELSKEYEQNGSDSLPTPPPDLADALSDKASHLKKELEEFDARMTQLEAEVDNVFKDSRDHPYRLHAVFTHRGGTKGGHYWIYIYDFQNDLWRKYNDDHVTLVNENEIFEQDTAAQPPASTGVVYISEDRVNEITEAVKRMPIKEDAPQNVNGHADTQMSDVRMQDVDDEALPPLVPVTYNDVQIIEGVEKA